MEPTGLDKVAIVFDHSIADELRTCVGVFKGLLKDLKKRNLHHEDEVISQKWIEEFERLRVWSANIGAHQRGTASLDFRLRDASHISDQIVSLLKSLRQSLQDIEEYLQDASQADHKVADDQVNFSLAENDDKTEYQELYESTATCIDCLFEMSLAVRKPSKLDRLSGLRKQLQGSFQQDDLRRLKDLFPRADPRLHETLAAALTLRRGVLKHYDQRQQNYARGASMTFDDTASQAGPSKSMFAATEYNADKGHDETKSISARSNRSLSSLMDENRAFYIPIPKELSDRRPFPCPYCHYLLDTYDKRDFIRHVLDDITPYQCIFPNCLYNQELLSSRSAWLQHLKIAHGADWQKKSTEPCMLCAQAFGDNEPKEKHISRHLEEIALDVIPIPDAEDSNEVELEKIDELEENVETTDAADQSAVQASKEEADSINPKNSEIRSAKDLEESDNSDQEDSIIIDGWDREDQKDFFRKRGKTRMPKHLVSPEVLLELGYEYYVEHEKYFVVTKAIGRGNIDEILAKSKVRIGNQGSQSHDPERIESQNTSHRSEMLKEGSRDDLQLPEVGLNDESSGGESSESIKITRETRRQLRSLRESLKVRTNMDSGEEEELMPSVLSLTAEERADLESRGEDIRRRILTLEAKQRADRRRKRREEYDKSPPESPSPERRRYHPADTLPDFTDDNQAQNKTDDVTDPTRPTYIKCRVKHLSPETLDHYNLPWMYDPGDESYVIIKEYIDHEMQQILFAHTAEIYKRRNAQVDESSDTRRKV